MSSWVRYSVAVYIGLLISGALARQPWQATNAQPEMVPSVYHEVMPPTDAAPTKDPSHAHREDASV